jgi:hypothetical protein
MTAPEGWQPIATAPRVGNILLLLGTSIPDVPYVRVGNYLDGPESEELGYREYAKYGSWMIWHDCGGDWYCIDVTRPVFWAHIPALPPAAVIMESVAGLTLPVPPVAS